MKEQSNKSIELGSSISNNNKKQKGGFLLDLLFGKSNKRRTQTKKAKTALEESKDSEVKLIKSYENLATVSKKYYEDYNKHLENLITLDDINGMTGLQTTFKNVIVKNLFKGTDKVDQSSPILLKNYLVSENTTPKYFRKEHLISQIRYKMANFSLKDTLLISQYDVSLVDNKAIINFKMINGDTHEKSVSVDNNFNMDLSKLQSDIRDIIKNMKKKMDYEIEIADDFELTEADLEIPGLEFADPGTALERKIKALQTSVKVDSATLADTKPYRPSLKKAPSSWKAIKQPRITPSIIKKQSQKQQYKGRDNAKVSFKGDEKPGQLDKGKPDAEQQLQELIEKKPGMPQGNVQADNQALKTDKQRNEKKFGELIAECGKYSDKENCEKNDKCFYYDKTKKCMVNTKKLK